MLAGKFSLAESYKHLIVTNGPSQFECDRVIWKVVAPQKVRVFLWLLVRNGLLTNEERIRKGMTTSPFCEQYGRYVESAIHFVRDCDFVQTV